MTNSAKCVLWALLGPTASICIGFALFLLFGFVLGPGMDIDNMGTPTQKFIGAASPPALCVVPVIGTFFSFWMAIAKFRQR